MTEDNPFQAPAAAREINSADIPRLEPPQDVTYDFGEDDLRQTLVHIHDGSSLMKTQLRKTRRRLLIVSGISAAVGGIFWFFDSSGNQQGPQLTWLICFGVSVGLLTSVFRLRKTLEKNLAQNYEHLVEEARESVVYGTRRYALEKEGLSAQDKAGHAFRRWWAIERIDATDDYLYLFSTKYDAYPIPKRAFVDEARFHGFCELAKRLTDENRGAKPRNASDAGEP